MHWNFLYIIIINILAPQNINNMYNKNEATLIKWN